jgi:PhzF family phenazine biosynthesis protein
MGIKIFQVDAFATEIFQGNPAAVIPLTNWLPDELMQKIAMENNLSETAFFVPKPKGFHIRWFTPLAEVDLCGHATLATAHVLFHHLNYGEKEIQFESKSGILNVKRANDLLYLNFPTSDLVEIEIPDHFKNAFQFHPEKCLRGRDDLMLIFNHEREILNLNPNFHILSEAKVRGVITTSVSETYDFVSRFFGPAVGINEDPVTGSAHTMLIPYWSKALKKDELIAKQVSKRGGILHCKNLGKRVEIGGKAVTYLTGEITV